MATLSTFPPIILLSEAARKYGLKEARWRRPGKVISVEELAREVWGPHYEKKSALCAAAFGT